MIRLLTAADAAAYAALRREMLVDTPAAFGSSPETDRVNDLAAFTRQFDGPGFAIVGHYEPGPGAPGAGSLVSVAGLKREDRPKRRHIATVWGVYTTPRARRRGLSRGVISCAIDLARTWERLAVLELSVSELAPGARALYESLGFTAWGVEPDALRVDGQSAREIHMQLRM
jgi:RimJ/RimL family protein N-acetyltransferase